MVYPLYPLDPRELYVNVGFWSTVLLAAGERPNVHNWLVERLVADLDGRKSLYSTLYYDEEELWASY